MAKPVLGGGIGPEVDVGVLVLQLADRQGSAVEMQLSRINRLHSTSLPDSGRPPCAGPYFGAGIISNLG